MAKKIEVHLRDEGTVIEGTITETNVGRSRLQQTLRWQCPCGAQIDTATIQRGSFYDVTGGYFLRCPGCGRWYMHHCQLGYVEGGRRSIEATSAEP